MTPAYDGDELIYEGRMNMGAISIHFPMILRKAQLRAVKEGGDVHDIFFEELEYYLQLIRQIHIRTYEYFSHKKAGTNPLAFCQGGIYGGHFDPEQEIGREFLRPMTASFGITALNETQLLWNGKSLVQDRAFAKEVLQYVRNFGEKYKPIDGILYAYYGTPKTVGWLKIV